MDTHLNGSLLIRRKNQIAWLTLNRPKKCNALDPALLEQLLSFFNQEAKHYSQIILQGAGPYFCAGADLKYMTPAEQQSPGHFSKLLSNFLSAYAQTPAMTICAIHGGCYGGAMGILSATDYVISDPNTQFACPEIKHQMIPKIIHPLLAKRLSKRQCKQLMLMGQIHTAQDF